MLTTDTSVDALERKQVERGIKKRQKSKGRGLYKSFRKKNRKAVHREKKAAEHALKKARRAMEKEEAQRL